jgi:alkanesulfonate monooxygenase SsuD/methylene tetrahydromethanopterin reductase-like flavin-dependent oxidoreductase (luciferase family)
MQFGLFGTAQANSGRLGEGIGQGFHDYAEFNVEAEALGFRSAFLVEHHFTGWTQVSATLNLLTWVAAKTRTLRLGTAVMVLPWHNPVLLAEQAATLDLLSGGRLDFGVGKGYRANEFGGFNVPIEEAEARFDEALEVIVKSWTSTERFSHQGRFWTFNDIVVEPPTAQRPHPPIWMGAGSPASIQKVARRGYNLILDQYASPQRTGEKIELFKRECAAIGRRFDPMQVTVARDLYVAKNQADKEAALARHLETSNRTLEVARAANRKGGSHILSYDDRAGGTEANTMYGTPDEIIEKLDALRAAGVTYVLFNIPGGSRDSLRRLARDILPAFMREPAAATASRA